MSADYVLKRPFDVALSSIGLALSSPFWAATALAIWLEDGLPIFYRSERVGRGGELFRTFKFRTMIKDSDAKFGPMQAGEKDPRITAVGRIIRPLAVDELPQLWSIFVGDMSFVGPRALLPAEIEVKGGSDEVVALSQIPGYSQRQSVRPGLTGIAQIFAPRDIVRKHKFKYDRLYIKKIGFSLDIRLILLSFWISFRGKWETRTNKF